MRTRAALAASLVLGTLIVPALEAAEVRLFLTQSQEQFRAGELDSISIDPLGILRLAHRAEQLAAIEEPFLLSAAPLPGNDGWVIGTGNAGRVLKVDREGKSETLFTTEEPEVFAVWADAKGAVYAGSSPDGKVYRHAGGKTSVFYDPDQTYIWEVEGDGKGGILVATGTEGKLFRVDGEGKGSVLYDSDDAHLRSIGVLGDGSVLVGSAGLGLVLRVEASDEASPAPPNTPRGAPRPGQVRTVYDAGAPEVVAFTPDGSGGAYFAVLASEASLIDLGGAADRSKDKNGEQKQDDDDDDDDGDSGDEGSAEVDFGNSSSLSSGSRPASFQGARSEVLHWTREAGVQSVWKFTDETVYSLLWLDGRLWVGTGLEGKLYSHQSERMMLEKDVDQSQIVALLPGDAGPAFATTNGAALFRFTKGMERKGTLTSDVFDAGLQSTFGTLHWRGVEPAGTKVRFSARGGLSALPDKTWSEWSAARDGQEISLRDLEQCRYFQWRVELESSSDLSPEVHAVEISYLQSNQPPLLEELTVLDPGQILVPSNFNPQNQVFEPAYPNREGIFTTLEETKDSRGLKPLWKRGFRTLRWTARDPNADELIYTVSVRREDEAQGWLEMKDELEDDRYSFDATVLPDGLYRFRVMVSDERGNDGSAGATANRTSEAVVIDHSPPTVVSVERDDAPSSAPKKNAPEGVVSTTPGGAKIRVVIEDSWNIVREAVWSADVSPWENALVDDGLLDSRRETLVLEPAKGAKLLLLRLTDAAYNVFTYDLSQHLEGSR